MSDTSAIRAGVGIRMNASEERVWVENYRKTHRTFGEWRGHTFLSLPLFVSAEQKRQKEPRSLPCCSRESTYRAALSAEFSFTM